jgi:hypothetical protein
VALRGGWEHGSYSIARFALVAPGSATRLVFDHTGLPEGEAGRLAAGGEGEQLGSGGENDLP